LENGFRWGEDFGLFTQQIPGAMFGLGAGNTCPPLHSDDYQFPDELIETGSKMFYQIAKSCVGS
jgi:metal-dependent amidase/aminoacylase/carboxypeptidase family protein